MPGTLDAEAALEQVIAFLDAPPQPGSPEDEAFGERLRQVIAASIPAAPDDDEDDAPVLGLNEDLRRRLEAAARKRGENHPFGDHPGGIGPTLGMNLGKP